MRSLLVSIWIILMIFLRFSVHAQTCCSGGVPVSANLGFQSAESHVTQIGVSADFNFLRTLKVGTEILDDDQRLRTTQSYILRAAHTWHPKWTAEIFLPVIRQTRRISTLPGAEADRESTFGIGDPVALLIYTVTDKKATWRIGLGPQVPLGSTTQTNQRGLFLVEDLQPGSGAWDVIAMSSLEMPLANRPSALIYANTILSLTGRNNDARQGLQTYEFGNDIQATLGYSDQVLLGTTIFQPGISLRYRHAESDRVDDSGLPGTGGDFVFSRFSSSIPIGQKGSSLNLNVELPLWSRVNDTQLSPTLVLNIGWFHRIDHKTKSDLMQIDNTF